MTDHVQGNIRKSMIASILIGIGIMAGIDEIIFHQLLSWHHFYDLSTPKFALFSDGLLHSAELIVLVAGFFMLADLRSRQALASTAAWSGFFIGLGGFQLFDGLIDHKILRLHQIRYGIDNLLIYDILWNASGAILLLIGIILFRRTRTSRNQAA